MSRGLKPGLGFARRHVYRLVYALALIGVPLGVIYGTGGLHTIGFWAMAVLRIPMAMIGLGPFLFLLMLPLAPIVWIVDKLLGGRLERNSDRLLPVAWSCLALVIFILGADLGYTGDVRLPTPWPNVGALVVMAFASAVFAGLLWLGSILEVPTPRARSAHSPIRRAAPEPDEEFWSDQMVEGWRAWRWEGGSLHGVWDKWRSAEYSATCQECRVVPSWNHSCGIYAVKRADSVYRFHQSSSVVGRVEMWGSVIEHEHGYRAEHARITDLWSTSETLVDQIESAYSVPVHIGEPGMERKEVHG